MCAACLDVAAPAHDSSETAANPEIAALTQHQDPASDGAAATNKAITLELAKQSECRRLNLGMWRARLMAVASVGGDPQLALRSGTFEPGDVGDQTGAGNTCDDATDDAGCIFTQNLIVNDATPDEIDAAVAAGGGVTGGAATGAAASAGAANEANNENATGIASAAGADATTLPASANEAAVCCSLVPNAAILY